MSIIYGLCKLCKPSISQKARQQIMKRHIVTIVFFLMTNLYLQLGVYVAYNPLIKNPDLEKWQNVGTYSLKLLYAFQGFIMPVTRLSEPYFYSIVLKKLRAIPWPCCSSTRRLED